MNRVLPLLLTLLTGMTCFIACTNGTDVVEVQIDAEVKRATPVAWAGVPDSASGTIPKLTDYSWHDLPQGGLVTTDDAGEAVLNLDGGCMFIYVFKKSSLYEEAQLIDSPCDEPAMSSNNWICAAEGSTLYIKTCGPLTTIKTVSGDEVSLEGTAVAVTYFPDRELTLFVTLEGVAQVMPRPDGETTTEPFVLENGFIFFVPPQAEDLQQIGELQAGTVYELAAMGAFDNNESFVAQLGQLTSTPDLSSWFARTTIRAREENVIVPPEFPSLPDDGASVLEERVFQVNLSNHFAENPALAGVMLQGLEWTIVTDNVNGLEGAGVLLRFENGRVEDSRTFTTDPDAAFALIEEQGGIQEEIVIVFPDGNEQMMQFSELLVSYFSEFGIKASMIAPPFADYQQLVSQQLAAGLPVIWFEP
jgi:hypothetical protein